MGLPGPEQIGSMTSAPPTLSPDIRSLLQLHHQQALQRLEQWIAREEQLAGALLQQARVAPRPAVPCPTKMTSDDSPPPEPMPALVPKQETRLLEELTTRSQQASRRGAVAAETQPVVGTSNLEEAKAKAQAQARDDKSESSENEAPDEDGAFDKESALENSNTVDASAQGTTAADRRQIRFPRRSRQGPSFDSDEHDIEDMDVWTQEETDTLANQVLRTNKKMRKAASVLDLSGGKLQQASADIVANPRFEMASAAAVVLNTLLIGVEVEITAREGLDKTPLPLQIADYTFTAWFAAELGIRLAGYGCHVVHSRQRGWILFDAFLVASSFVDLLVGLFTDVNETRSLSTARIIRILRITRMIRVMRVVRVVRFVRALRIMIYSIMSTLKSVVWAVVLLFMVIYFFAIVFTEAMSEHRYTQVAASQDELCPPSASSGSKFWGSLGASMLTLLESVIGGVDWQDPLEPLANIHWFWLTIFVAFILFTYFAILNVVTAAFCQGALEGQQYDREQTVKDLLTNKKSDLYKTSDLFANMFSKIDLDGSGEITWEEFKSHLSDDSVQALLALLELNDSDLWVLFRMLDANQSHCIDAREFISGCMRLRGPARSIDLAKVSFDQKRLTKRIVQFMRFVKGEITQIRTSQLAMSENGTASSAAFDLGSAEAQL